MNEFNGSRNERRNLQVSSTPFCSWAAIWDNQETASGHLRPRLGSRDVSSSSKCFIALKICEKYTQRSKLTSFEQLSKYFFKLDAIDLKIRSEEDRDRAFSNGTLVTLEGPNMVRNSDRQDADPTTTSSISVSLRRRRAKKRTVGSGKKDPPSSLGKARRRLRASNQ
ncbi:hypothetical protein TNIN_352681 [Trichonephila inaurata madagascariensis]|uniref:Uncharacterized protein n=1 Tax=Trichonephila inaurata madagascariensis TaxID=2747483 RepID=A0A8X6XCX9_9ARAC|nr:hypothetical protein TNIN_352681 [Trichonephila inaurata madagascariensis]